MFCCLESPCSDPQSAYYSQVATDEKLLDKNEVDKKGAGASSYPGLRRKPHGPPADFPVPPERMGNRPFINNGLISVTVPPGTLPGQEIHVRRPDGTGLVEAVVPAGMQEGSVFHVQAPPIMNPLQLHSQPPQYQPPAAGPSSAPTASTGVGAPPPKGDFTNCLLDDNANAHARSPSNTNPPAANKPVGKTAQKSGEDGVLPIIGGLATGVAAIMAYEHYS